MKKQNLTLFTNLSRQFPNFPTKKKIIIGVILSLAMIIFWLAVVFVPPGIDWRDVYRPSALALLKGTSPYTSDGFYNAPWTALLLLPFAVFPENIGSALLVIASMVSLTYTAYRLGAKPIAVMCLVLSPPAMHCILTGNVDLLAVLGFIMPPQIGLFFIGIKPQLGIAVAIYWMFEAWKKNGWREVLRVFGPYTICLLVSFFIFGFWISRFNSVMDEWWNASLWPQSIPVGLALLIASIRKRKLEYAMAASPCLSPHVLLHSWVGALLAIAKSVPELIVAVCGLWIVAIFL